MILSEIKNFIRIMLHSRSAIYELAKRDFAAVNKSTYLGIFWGFVHPLTYVGLLILVFAIGLRSNPGKDVPFVVYLICGMIPWQFFSTVLNSLTRVIRSHSFLVRKGNFNLGILHVAKILSNLVTHLVLIIFCFVICHFYGFHIGLHSLQIIYYMAVMCILLLGLGWITSSTSLFVEDIANMVVILIQFGFWLTPIIWNIKMIPTKYQWIVKINPVFYIVSGYRDSFIYRTALWEKPHEILFFWAITIIILMLGVIIFRRLKPHFGEVI